jgi:hypothetical protein
MQIQERFHAGRTGVCDMRGEGFLDSYFGIIMASSGPRGSRRVRITKDWPLAFYWARTERESICGISALGVKQGQQQKKRAHSFMAAVSGPCNCISR